MAGPKMQGNVKWRDLKSQVPLYMLSRPSDCHKVRLSCKSYTVELHTLAENIINIIKFILKNICTMYSSVKEVH